MLIAEDRCDLAYPQLTALDTIQHEPTAQAHLEFQRAFCERMLKKARPRVRSFARPRPIGLGRLPPLLDSPLPRRHGPDARSHRRVRKFSSYLDQPRFSATRQHALGRSLPDRRPNLPRPLALYEKQLAQGTDPARVLYLLATTSQKHDPEGAQKRRLELLENHPHSKHARNSLSHLPKKLDARTAYAKAHTYYSHKRYNQAIKSFRNFIREHSGDQRVC